MTAPTVIDRKLVADTFEARLITVPNAQVFVGEPSAVELKPGADGRVKPYVVLYASTGTPAYDTDLGDQAVDLSAWVQISCCGDSPQDVAALVSRVDATFYRWTPVIEGYACGRLKPPPGFDPGPPRPDKSVQPTRFYVPLQYAFTVTAT